MPQIPYLNELQSVSLSKENGLFDGGLNLKTPEIAINDGESPDLWNVEFTKEHSIRARGFPTEKGVLPDDPDNPGSKIIPRGSYSFIDFNNINWCVLTNNKYHFISDDLQAWITINPSNPVNPDYKTRMAFINGKLYGTNGISDVWSYDITGPTLTQHPSIPKGRFILTHNERLIIANVPGQGDWVYYSNIDDETNFYHPVKTTVANKFRINSRSGEPITGLISYEGKLFIFTAYSVSVWMGWDDRDFVLQTISKQIGCANNNTIQEFNGFVVWLGTDGNFYKSDGRNILPIGDNIQPGLKGKMVQVATYQEVFYKHGQEGTTQWDDYATKREEAILPNGDNYNKEPTLIPGSLVNFGQAVSEVRNPNFESGWSNWNYLDHWANSANSIGSGRAQWGIDGIWATIRTEFNTDSWGFVSWLSHKTTIKKVELVFVNPDTGLEIGGVWQKAWNIYEDDGNASYRFAFPYNQEIYLNNYAFSDPNNPPFFGYHWHWGEWEPEKLKYRKLKMRVKIWRYDFTYNFAGWVDRVDEGGYTYVECDAGYISKNGQAQFLFRIEPIFYTTGISDERFKFHGLLGFMMQTTGYSPFYTTKDIEITDIDKWGGFYADYDNKAQATIIFQYSIWDGSAWSPMQNIFPGDTITGAVGNGIKIRFNIICFNSADRYEIVIFNYIGFDYYTRNEDLPTINADMCSIVYDGKYYCAMGVYGMGIWNNKNNVVWVLDEYVGRPRWSRWDIFVDTIVLFANKVQFWNRNGGFVLDENKNLMTQTEFEKFNVGMPFYYRTKNWDFGLPNIQKRFKYIDFNIYAKDPIINRGVFPFFHIEVLVNDSYSGTWLNYYLVGGIDMLLLISHDLLTRVAKIYPMRYYGYAYNYNSKWLMHYEYPLPQKKVIGFGKNIGTIFRFATIIENANTFVKLNYDIISMVFYTEIKDYKPMKLYKRFYGSDIRSDG